MTKNEVKLFNRFLKDNGVFTVFRKRFDYSHAEDFLPSRAYNWENESVNSYLKVVKNVYAISTAFEWDNTPEGNNFWSELDDKWIRTFYNL